MKELIFLPYSGVKCAFLRGNKIPEEKEKKHTGHRNARPSFDPFITSGVLVWSVSEKLDEQRTRSADV